MIRNALIVFKEIDIRNYFIKGVLFSPSPYQYVAVCVFYDADDLTQLTSWIVSVFSFALKFFRCRGPPTFNFKK